MRKNSYSVQEFIKMMKVEDIQTLMSQQHQSFKRRFGLVFDPSITVVLCFESTYDTQDFYNEIRLNAAYQRLYAVSYNTEKQNSLLVSGKATLFDYFGTKEPNLLTASRDLNIGFSVDFVQDYTGTTFKGEVLNGELLARQCIIEVSAVLPELGLGGLRQIATSVSEFDLLLTRIVAVQEEVLL